MKKIDVTDKVGIGSIRDEELIPITKCICGSEFSQWEFVISIYPEDNWIYSCPVCGAKLMFGMSIRVYQVVE